MSGDWRTQSAEAFLTELERYKEQVSQLEAIVKFRGKRIEELSQQLEAAQRHREQDYDRGHDEA